jgi:E3 ubiquitin-protein ligase SIAH1
MDDLPRALDEALLRELECPVCMEYMVPPINLCTNGHNVCNKCRKSVKCCPTCRAKFSKTRNLAVENIARSQKYPCANRQRGCIELFSIEHIAKHQTLCVYGKIKCPLHLFRKCSWKGQKNDLKEHVKTTHSNFYRETPIFTDPHLAISTMVVFYFGKIFTYYKDKRNGRCYAAVQLIGTSNEASKYKCEYTLSAANGIDQISNTFLVQASSRDFETIFKSGKCINLDEETVKYFVKDEKLQMSVKLSKV